MKFMWYRRTITRALVLTGVVAVAFVFGMFVYRQGWHRPTLRRLRQRTALLETNTNSIDQYLPASKLHNTAVQPEWVRRSNYIALNLRVQPGNNVTFSVPPTLVSEAGYGSGVDHDSPDVRSRSSLRTLTLTNRSTRTATLDAVYLNHRGLIFTERGFFTRYPLHAEQKLDTLLNYFWDDFALMHHASPQKMGPRGLQNPMIWNALGFQLCGQHNRASNRLFQLASIASRRPPVHGHVVNEFFVERGWRLFDFDRKAYYLDIDGNIIGRQQAVNFPQLVLEQQNNGPQSLRKNINNTNTRAAIAYQKSGSMQSRKFPDRHLTPLTIRPRESVQFGNEPAKNTLTNYTKRLWKNPNFYLRKGSFDFAPITQRNDPIVTLSKELPFWIDGVSLSCRCRLAKGEHFTVMVRIGESMLPVCKLTDRDNGEQQVECPLPVTSNSVELQLLSSGALHKDGDWGIADLNVRLWFQYNVRTLQDLPANSSLGLAGNGGPLNISFELDNSYSNDVLERKEPLKIEQLERGISATINSPPDANAHEVYLTAYGQRHPTSPSHYFLQKESNVMMRTDILTAGKYQIHYRVRYQDGLWSHWKISESIDVRRLPHLTLKFALAKNKLRGWVEMVDNSTKDTRTLYVLLSANRFFPTRVGGFFLRSPQAGGPLEFSTEAPATFYRCETVIGQAFHIPDWAAFAIICSDAGMRSKLIDVRQSLLADGIDPDLIREGSTITAKHERIVGGRLQQTRLKEVNIGNLD